MGRVTVIQQIAFIVVWTKCNFWGVLALLGVKLVIDTLYARKLSKGFYTIKQTILIVGMSNKCPSIQSLHTHCCRFWLFTRSIYKLYIFYHKPTNSKGLRLPHSSLNLPTTFAFFNDIFSCPSGYSEVSKRCSSLNLSS